MLEHCRSEVETDFNSVAEWNEIQQKQRQAKSGQKIDLQTINSWFSHQNSEELGKQELVGEGAAQIRYIRWWQ